MNLSSVIILVLVIQSECALNSSGNMLNSSDNMLNSSDNMLNSSDNMTQCANVKTDLGLVRKRRHLTFPDETSVVLTISLVKTFMTHAPSGWNMALEIDVIFPLPDEKFTNRFFRRKLHHKQKRELWENIQDALDYYHINGHDCIFRAICETRQHIAPPGKSLVHDILRVIFTASGRDEEFLQEMRDHYDFSDPNFCERRNDCPFSVLDFVLSLKKK